MLVTHDPNRTQCWRATRVLQSLQLVGESNCAPKQSPVTLTLVPNLSFTSGAV